MPSPSAVCVPQLGVQGILVLDTRKGGPAAKAGIQGTSRDANGRLVLGDIIVKFNGHAIRCVSMFRRRSPLLCAACWVVGCLSCASPCVPVRMPALCTSFR